MIAPMVSVGCWILSPVGKHQPRSVILVALSLVNHYSREKDAAWPSIRLLAHELDMDERSVRRAIEIITSRHGPFDRSGRRGPRPQMYRLRPDMAVHSRGDKDVRSRQGNGAPSRPDIPDRKTGHRCPSRPDIPVRAIDSKNPPIEPTQEPGVRVTVES